MKPRNWQITEALVEVLKDFDCSLDEAKNLLQDAYTDYDAQMEDAYQRQQDSLSESGGRDDSQFRKDMVNAGRGHLLR
ncbi:hypothetical protein [Mesorhizobium sp. B2-5-11]|uniref:hypothetical protein n=1 Tax=Mesorhizobium sp. B2-5-11 TaxID=2589919 RepID=UPI0011283C67|nr:hypothetical protein [Mesorhizobium sp. B2-5-11]TPK14134.1 hypothetical protein FJ490_02085 [Mesorhizobium sp. B2-5-11]